MKEKCLSSQNVVKCKMTKAQLIVIAITYLEKSREKWRLCQTKNINM